MLETIAKGFIIGLLVSSPMGPINMLTIQRTLNRGRRHGFVSGLGAMLSDISYALLTLLGMSFVTGFMAAHEKWIQLTGGVILILFGLGVFRTNPLKDWKPDEVPKETRYFKDYLSSFLLTISNAAIILVFVGLYTRFSFNPIADGLSYLFAGVTAFIVAAFSWWFFLTLFVSRLRRHFNRKGLTLLNRTVGSIFMLVGAGGILLSLFPNLF
ncbi:MAG: LysE family translocator [Proteiniphilum sp.]|nr:LysE family translocator [Proteiniphilum sp.]